MDPSGLNIVALLNHRRDREGQPLEDMRSVFDAAAEKYMAKR